jgi:SPP1 gp7 family putative phage head morphogenesis protein
MKSYLTKIVDMESSFFDIEVDVEKVLAAIWGLDATTWLVRLLSDIDLWDARLRADIKRLISRGANIEDVLNTLEKRFDSIDSVLTTLAISEATAIGSIARKSIFRELGVGKYQFFSKPDERRCETCGALHGKIFPMSAYEVGVTASPIHPRCRCWEVPILE